MCIKKQDSRNPPAYSAPLSYAAHRLTRSNEKTFGNNCEQAPSSGVWAQSVSERRTSKAVERRRMLMVRIFTSEWSLF